MSNMWRR